MLIFSPILSYNTQLDQAESHSATLKPNPTENMTNQPTNHVKTKGFSFIKQNLILLKKRNYVVIQDNTPVSGSLFLIILRYLTIFPLLKDLNSGLIWSEISHILTIGRMQKEREEENKIVIKLSLLFSSVISP